MSILTTLALVASSVVAKIRQAEPEPMDVEITRLQARIDGMNASLTKLETQIHDLTRERDSWYELTVAWRRRYETLRDAPRITEQRPTPESIQQTYANLQANQMIQYERCSNAQMAQNAQGLAMQDLAQAMRNAWPTNEELDRFVCNCVPARHDLFLRG